MSIPESLALPAKITGIIFLKMNIVPKITCVSIAKINQVRPLICVTNQNVLQFMTLQ